MTYAVSDIHGGVVYPDTRKESNKIENASALAGNLYHNSKNGTISNVQNGTSGAMLMPITTSPQPRIFLCI